MGRWMLLGVMLSTVAVAQSNGIIGSYPLTCITFDRYNSWEGENSFTASRWIWLDKKGVTADIHASILDNKGGRFVYGSRVKIPFFKSNDFFKLSISLWFKKSKDKRMIILSTGQCSGSSIYIKSIGDTELVVKVKTGTNYVSTATVPTPSQTADFVHVAVTFSTTSGLMKVYINGNMAAQKPTKGKILQLPGAMEIGSSECPKPAQTNFRGYMDSVSFARCELTAAEVADLYTSRGSCIGE